MPASGKTVGRLLSLIARLSAAEEAEPALAAGVFFNAPSGAAEGFRHLVGALVDDAGTKKYAAGLEKSAHLAGQADDHVCHDVGNHHVVAAAELRGQLPIREDVAPADGIAIPANAVEGGVFIGHVHARLVDVAGKSTLRAQQQRRNRQYPAAAAQVQYPLAAVEDLLQRRQAQSGGGVVSGAEGEAGVEPQDDAPGGFSRFPFRHHDQPLADLHGLIKLFPVVFPVGVRHGRYREGKRRGFRPGGAQAVQRGAKRAKRRVSRGVIGEIAGHAAQSPFL